MGRTACTEPQHLYKGALFTYTVHSMYITARRTMSPAITLLSENHSPLRPIFLPNKICERTFCFQRLHTDNATGKTTYICRFICFIWIILPFTLRGWEKRFLHLMEEYTLKEVYMRVTCPEIFLPMKDEPGDHFRILLVHEEVSLYVYIHSHIYV